MLFETIVTLVQATCQSAVVYDAWSRHQRACSASDFFCHANLEIVGKLGKQIGQGCFGSVFHLQRRGPNFAKHCAYHVLVIFISFRQARCPFLSLRCAALPPPAPHQPQHQQQMCNMNTNSATKTSTCSKSAITSSATSSMTRSTTSSSSNTSIIISIINNNNSNSTTKTSSNTSIINCNNNSYSNSSKAAATARATTTAPGGIEPRTSGLWSWSWWSVCWCLCWCLRVCAWGFRRGKNPSRRQFSAPAQNV